MKRILLATLLLLVGVSFVAIGQVPGPTLTIGSTPITNGTNNDCLYIASGRLGQQACGTGTAADIKVGTTTITSGTTTRVLFDNAGVLGEYTISGTGSVAMSSSAALTTPSIVADTWANIKATAPATGTLAYASDFGTGGNLLRYNGTRWKPVSGKALLATLDTPVTGITTTETVGLQYLMPTGLLQTHDRLYWEWNVLKPTTGTTNTFTIGLRIGTTGVVTGGGADTQIFSLVALSAASRQMALAQALRLESATSVQLLGQNAGSLGYSGGSNAALAPAAVTITSAAANPLYFSLTGILNGATDTGTVLDASLYLESTAN